MEEHKSNSMQFCSNRIVSSEIIEISEEIQSMANSRDVNDVYVAVGKDDLHVLKWALDRLVSPGARVFLVHVFPSMPYISTPVGKLSRSQLSHEQVRYYVNEEQNKRRNLLQKYIRLCNDSKVSVDTMLIESHNTAKAILDLIPVLNITTLVIGTTRSPPRSRLFGKRSSKAEFVKKNAPEYCEITIVDDATKPKNVDAVNNQNQNSERKHSTCACFPVSRKNVEK